MILVYNDQAAHAGFWVRLAAFALDAMVLGVVQFFLVLRPTSAASPPADAQIALDLIAAVAGPAYFWLLTGMRGQTLGKMVLMIQVVDSQGRMLSLGSAVLRELLGKGLLLVGPALILFVDGTDELASLLLILVFMLVGLLGFLWIAWDHRKQGWHDKLARTYVVKKPRPDSQHDATLL